MDTAEGRLVNLKTEPNKLPEMKPIETTLGKKQTKKRTLFHLRNLPAFKEEIKSILQKHLKKTEEEGVLPKSSTRPALI